MLTLKMLADILKVDVEDFILVLNAAIAGLFITLSYKL